MEVGTGRVASAALLRRKGVPSEPVAPEPLPDRPARPMDGLSSLLREWKCSLKVGGGLLRSIMGLWNSDCFG